MKNIEIIEKNSAVTSLLLSFTIARVIACCEDQTIKVFGLKSGGKMKELPKIQEGFI